MDLTSMSDDELELARKIANDNIADARERARRAGAAFHKQHFQQGSTPHALLVLTIMLVAGATNYVFLEGLLAVFGDSK